MQNRFYQNQQNENQGYSTGTGSSQSAASNSSNIYNAFGIGGGLNRTQQQPQPQGVNPAVIPGFSSDGLQNSSALSGTGLIFDPTIIESSLTDEYHARIGNVGCVGISRGDTLRHQYMTCKITEQSLLRQLEVVRQQKYAIVQQYNSEHQVNREREQPQQQSRGVCNFDPECAHLYCRYSHPQRDQHGATPPAFITNASQFNDMIHNDNSTDIDNNTDDMNTGHQNVVSRVSNNKMGVEGQQDAESDEEGGTNQGADQASEGRNKVETLETFKEIPRAKEHVEIEQRKKVSDLFGIANDIETKLNVKGMTAEEKAAFEIARILFNYGN